MKVDFKKSLDSYRARHLEFRIADVPSLPYLMADGHGDPNTASEYADAIGALYPIAYKIKFASKQDLGRDYVVPPLEALWWASDMDAFTTDRDKSQSTTPSVRQLRRIGQPASTRSRFERLDEGSCVQTLHIGSYDDETEVLAELHHDFIPNSGLRMTAKHHEIYLSDARKVEVSKLRTILRQPVVEA